MSSFADPSHQLAATAPPLLLVVAAANPARCRALRALVGASGFAVVAEATSPAELERAVARYRPGAVLLDTDMTGGGLESIERLMASAPTPIVVCGAAADQPQVALAAGAVSVVGVRDGLPGSVPYVIALRHHLHVASRVRVITHPRGRWQPRQVPGAAAAALCAPTGQAFTEHSSPGGSAVPSTRTPALAAMTMRPLRVAPGRPPVAQGADALPLSRPACEIVVIGASTGGPPALARILGELPAGFDVPILVVQHMADGFIEGLADWLRTMSRLPVAVATDGGRLAPGTVSIAPAGGNVIVHRRLRLELVAPLPNQFHVPGIDVTFTSVAGSCRAAAVGVLLTGMGRDGAAGLRTMREAGAMTIAQDQPTSVVYGMPGAAIALDAVELQLPLPEIAAALTQLVEQQGPVGDASGGRRP